MSDATVAKLLLLALSFCWGLSWIAMRIALDEVSPWSMRLIGYSIGAATLLVLIKAQGRSLCDPARPRLAGTSSSRRCSSRVGSASPAPSRSSWRTRRG